MRRIFFIGFIIAVCGLAISAQDKKDKLVWKKAVIEEKQVHTQTTEREISDYTPMEKPRIDIKRVDTEWIMLKADEFTYFLSRKITKFWQKRLKTEKESQIEYAIEGDTMYLRTAKGKKIKYKIDNKFPN